MRMLTPALAASLLVGCASQPTPARSTAGRPAPVAAVQPAPSPSSAGLAFDPPGSTRAPDPNLSREARGPTATNGIEPATTKYDVSTYIQDTTDDGDFSQQSVTERTGTVQR